MRLSSRQQNSKIGREGEGGYHSSSRPIQGSARQVQQPSPLARRRFVVETIHYGVTGPLAANQAVRPADKPLIARAESDVKMCHDRFSVVAALPLHNHCIAPAENVNIIFVEMKK
jgi:hypothetical protein